MLGDNLRQLWESLGPNQCMDLLKENLASGEFRPEDFSLRELAEAFCGHEWVRRLNPRNLARYSTMDLLEAGEGVDVSAFSNITGQILYTKIMDGWNQAVAMTEKLVTNTPTQFDGEKIPFLGRVTEEGKPLRPGEPYPEHQFGERWIETPATQKYGAIVSITKEMVFFDRTGQALKRAGEIGERLGMGKSKRIWDGVLGFTNTYKFNGTTYNTYNVSPNTNWVNKQTGNALVDWTSVEKGYILASQILDPDTQNPIEVEFKQIVVMPSKLFTARRIFRATEVRSTFPGYSTATAPAPGNVQMLSANPITEDFDIISSSLAYQRLLANSVTTTAAVDYWYLGDFPRAFLYMENWPITVEQAPANNVKMFEQDIVHRTKASERGVFAIEDPRYVMMFTA